jgi:hypothetical protein
MVIFFKFLFIIIPLLYALTEKIYSLIVAGIFFVYFLTVKIAISKKGIFGFFLNSRFCRNIRNMPQEILAGYLYTLGAVFIVIYFFQKDVACYALFMSLFYLACYALLEKFSKLRFWNRSLDVILVLTFVLYSLSRYLEGYFDLSENLRYSVLAIPLADFFLRWPEERFSVVFFTAFIAQFIKNSF